MKRIVAICLCLVISSVCRAQVGYQGQSAISLGVAKTNYGVMADLRFMNQVTPRSAIGGEVVYNREQLSMRSRFLLVSYISIRYCSADSGSSPRRRA